MYDKSQIRVNKTTVTSKKSKSYRYLVLSKFVWFNIDYIYCHENHMVEEICIYYQRRSKKNGKMKMHRNSLLFLFDLKKKDINN